MRPGLIQLEIGVQSTNEQTLHAINRYMSLEHLRQVVDKIHSFHNIHQHLDLIAGLPYEDYDSFVTSFNDVYAMRPQQLQLGFLKVLKGSPIEEKAEEYGIVYNSRPPYEVLYSRWIPYDDVLRLKGIEEWWSCIITVASLRIHFLYWRKSFLHPLPCMKHCHNTMKRRDIISIPQRGHIVIRYCWSLHGRKHRQEASYMRSF